MNEETKNTTNALGDSAFARVLGRLMDERDIPAGEEHAVQLAEKSGLDVETFRARLDGESVYIPDLKSLAKEMDLSSLEMRFLALAYALEEEWKPWELENPTDASQGDPSRVTRPEEVIENYEELPEYQRMRPLRCQTGAATDSQCARDATTWMHPEDQDHPLCDEHAHADKLWREAGEWSIAEEVTGDWLRVARAWRFEELERLALYVHEDAKAGFLKAEARADAVQEMADAPRERRMEKIAALTPEQDAESRRLMRRADELNNAYTALQDNAVGKIPEENLRRTLATLADERDRANEEAHRYMEEIGIRPKA